MKTAPWEGSNDMPLKLPDADNLKWTPRSPWVNYHETVTQPVHGNYAVGYPGGDTKFTTLNDTTKAIQFAIAQAKANGLELRAVGSRWSLSRAPTTDGVVLATSRLNGWMKLKAADIDVGYKGDADARKGLFLFQCGMLIADLNEIIESDRFGRSLRTSGAANGQTIVGATSTGTHGSALSFGALHDHIVAIHLLAGDKKQYWLERAEYPVASKAVRDALGAEFKADDKLFNAALVSFGSFGVIANVVIETRPRFMLRAETIMPCPFDQDLRNLIATLDVGKYPALKDKGQPYFLQIVINPHSTEAMINVMYELPWKAGHQPNYHLKPKKIGPAYDALSLVAKLMQAHEKVIPFFFNLAEKWVDPKTKEGSWGELFGYKVPQTMVASGSIGVALGDALRTLDLLIALNKKKSAPLVFGCRFVRRSPALLAPQQFDTTMMISLDGIYNERAEVFFRDSADLLTREGIRFTQHWGKSNSYTKDRIVKAYTQRNLDDWLSARKTLLADPADRNVFTNDFMVARGLDG